MRPDAPTDEDLLTSGEPAAFGLFYERRVREVLGYMMRRAGDAEAAADLTAETFAAAIVARPRFRPGGAPASAWLFRSRTASRSTTSVAAMPASGLGDGWEWS